jgi:hypothetical protein
VTKNINQLPPSSRGCPTVFVISIEKKQQKQTESLFISIYVVYVLIVLIADIYHRAVMVPRIKHEIEMRERKRQIEAARVASLNAGDAWDDLAGGGGVGSNGEYHDDDLGASSIVSEGGGRGRRGAGGADGAGGHVTYDDRTHASAPPMMEDVPMMGCSTPIVKNRALNAVLTALSNYNDVEHDFDDVNFDGGGGGVRASRTGADATEGGDRRRRHRHNGWGVESTIDGSRSWDRPVVLHGADGILARHPHHHHHPQMDDGTENEHGIDRYNSPYRVMEDMDLVERLCVHDGSIGHPARGWVVAFHDARQELLVHFRERWSDILNDDESKGLDKFLMTCEYPLTVAREVRF